VGSDISEASRLPCTPYSFDLPSPYGSGLRMGPGSDTRSESGAPPSAKRKDRNAREQARSLKITQQIGKLKKVLEVDGRGSKSSKMSVLMGVEKYISELELEVANLDISCRQARDRKSKAQPEQADFAMDQERDGPGSEKKVGRREGGVRAGR
jgi:hypothetical protein